MSERGKARLPELVLRQNSRMVIRLDVSTAELPRFFIGGEVLVLGEKAQIEKMEALQSVFPGAGQIPLELTLLILR